MAEIVIQGKICTVDERDITWISLCNLTLQKRHKNYYVFIEEKPLHSLVLKAHGVELESGKVVDHRNRNSLDNRFSNLRQITNYENLCCNCKKRRGTSKYIGVSKLPNGMWRAQYSHLGWNIYLGMFETEKEAAVQHDLYAVTTFRNPLRLNFPEEMDCLKELLK